MVELLPCPFCGATDGRLVQGYTRATDAFEFWSVECLDCGAEVADDESQDKADAHWNTRPPADEALLIAVEALEWLYNDNYNPFEPDNQTMACNIISQALAKIKELGK